jgi:outer membrane protein assembly factor BamE (lipoprotein component of BamABCDE complex)
MKQLSIIIAVGLLASSAFAQIGTTPGGHHDTKKSHDSKVGDISNPEAETPPRVGMTKEQALARYGKPKRHTVTEDGEEWVYILNMGEVIGKAFIPFNFKPTPVRTGVLTFGPDGRVKKFKWDTDQHD